MPYFPKAECIVELFVQAEAISFPSLLSSVFLSAKRLLIAFMQDIRFIRYIDFANKFEQVRSYYMETLPEQTDGHN